jgi:hypothetical protein
MPHLDANALESDPEGIAFLRDVIGNRQEKSWPAPIAQLELLAQAKSMPEPLQNSRRRGRGRTAPRFEVVD